MKVDPDTGKAHSKDWERDLNLVHQAGFSYGHIQIVDLTTGKYFWQVDARRGEGPRVIVEMPTFQEAVSQLKRILSLLN